VKHVQACVSPTGEQYRVVAAPPGSALDAGNGRSGGGALGVVVALITVAVRSGRRGWRIAVTPCDEKGRPVGATYRERVADQGAAEARAEAISAAIRDGRWPEPPLAVNEG